MDVSNILNLLLGTGVVGLIIGIATLKSAVHKARAEADQAKAQAKKAEAEAETVRITNAENATRILVENIVKPLKEELYATREDLQATKKEMASTKRTMSRLARVSRLPITALGLSLVLCLASCATTKKQCRSRSRQKQCGSKQV